MQETKELSAYLNVFYLKPFGFYNNQIKRLKYYLAHKLQVFKITLLILKKKMEKFTMYFSCKFKNK